MTESAGKEGRLYRTAVVLLVLLALTVGLSLVDLGPANFSAALAIAAAKAALVVYYFMDLEEGVDAVRFMAAAALVWFGLLMAGTFAEYRFG